MSGVWWRWMGRSARRQAVWLGLFLCLCGCRGGDDGTRAPAAGAVPWPDAPWEYAIGILAGGDPLRLPEGAVSSAPPVMTARDVTDVTAGFVADPFMIFRDGGWHMFFEVMNAATAQGDIGYATSPDGRQWQYRGIVLDEPLHLSYPLVFAWEDKVYMVPECYRTGKIRLFVADAFPRGWRAVADLVEGEYVDPTLFRHADRWWLLAGNRRNTELYLFMADRLEGPWTEHPRSPVRRQSLDEARPGGRVFCVEGRLYRPAQDCVQYYGNLVRLFEITALTPAAYDDRWVAAEPYLSTNLFPWASWGMHQLDMQPVPGQPGAWLACVDGFMPVQPEVLFDARFKDAPTLQGMQLATKTRRPGEHVLARFYWDRAPDGPAEGLWAFVHVRMGGQLVCQADYRFERGKRVYETVTQLPDDAPAGVYTLWTGVYEPAHGRRHGVRTGLPSRRGAVRLPLTVAVTR